MGLRAILGLSLGVVLAAASGVSARGDDSDLCLDEFTSQGMAMAREVSEQVFNALGVSEIHHADTFQGAGHVIGTYRMGSNPNTSVVDANLRSHDHQNLYLLGSGVFPSVGTANPTLTIAALSIRASEAIASALG